MSDFEHEVGSTTCEIRIRNERLQEFLSQLAGLCKAHGARILVIGSIDLIYEPGMLDSQDNELPPIDQAGLNNVLRVSASGIEMEATGAEYAVNEDDEEVELDR